MPLPSSPTVCRRRRGGSSDAFGQVNRLLVQWPPKAVPGGSVLVSRDCVIWPRPGPFGPNRPDPVFAAHMARANPAILYPPASAMPAIAAKDSSPTRRLGPTTSFAQEFQPNVRVARDPLRMGDSRQLSDPSHSASRPSHNYEVELSARRRKPRTTAFQQVSANVLIPPLRPLAQNRRGPRPLPGRSSPTPRPERSFAPPEAGRPAKAGHQQRCSFLHMKAGREPALFYHSRRQP